MRRLLKGGILLIGLMLVFGLAACKGDPEPATTGGGKSGANALSTITVTDPDGDAATIVNATAISKADWEALLEEGEEIPSDKLGTIDFDDVAGGTGFILTAVPSNKATLTYAVGTTIVPPADGAFAAVPEDGEITLRRDMYVFFKIVAENNATAYYAFEVTGLTGNQASNSVVISSVNLNSGDVNLTAGAGNRAVDISDVQPATLNLSFSYSFEAVTLTLTKNNDGQAVNWAVTATDTPPAEVTGTMTNTTGRVFTASIAAEGLANGGCIWVKVTAENGDIMYYGWTASMPMNNVLITSVKVGGGANAPVTGAAASATLDALNPPLYTLGVTAAATAGLEFTRDNSRQTISWTKAAAKPANDTGFTPVTSTTDAISVAITGGVADGDIIVIKVVAADGTTVMYYGWEMSVGGEALLLSLELGSGGEAETDPWGAGVATFAELTTENANLVEPEDDQTPSGYTVSATANDGATVTFAYSASFLPSTAEPTFGPMTQQFFASGSYLYMKVVSPNGKNTRYYVTKVSPPMVAFIFYGQPKIQPVLVEVDDTATNFWERYEFDPDLLDPLWAGDEWPIDISRINPREGAAPWNFLNTKDGEYDVTGYGYVQGKAKAFWDDNGLYVYAEMLYTDYYNNQAAKDAGTLTAKTTRQSTNPAQNSTEHNFDSLEIFTNERLQEYTSGNYGLQYRVAPLVTGTYTGTAAMAPHAGTYTVASGAADGATGSPTGPTPITKFRNSDKYFTWIMYDDAGKELGYSCLAYIPWMFKGNVNATDVFDADNDDMVKTEGNDNGPEVGVEFQLNVANLTTRACVLTWNGIGFSAYQQCQAYGKFNLVTGDLTARGITRGEFDED